MPGKGERNLCIPPKPSPAVPNTSTPLQDLHGRDARGRTDPHSVPPPPMAKAGDEEVALPAMAEGDGCLSLGRDMPPWSSLHPPRGPEHRILTAGERRCPG